jgi:gliding motility-associated-like protein
VFFLIHFFALLPYSAIAQNEAPVLTATGNQIFCPGTPLNIVTDFNITDPDDTETMAIYIQISSGYVNGQDGLSLTGTHPTITTTWNAVAAKLTLNGVGGNVPYTDLIDAVEDVVYTNSSATPTAGIRTFSMTVGQANYLPSTQHYYQYVSNLGISWTSAKAAAEASTYYGLQGYLATLLAADEAQLCGEQATGTGWIGGSDSATEGVWKWVTGPEAGITFWNGAANGSSPNYEFWNTGEPNDSGGNEDYAHITAPGVGVPGSWNDLPNSGSTAPYNPVGYIVEYGGMPGDPMLQISASAKITVASISTAIPASRCGAGTVILQATTTGMMVYWYTAATGGLPVATGSSFTTPSLNATTTYYASPFDEDCSTGIRTPITATINAIPTVTVAAPASVCGQGTATLTATPSAGTVNWYSAATGGTPLGTGTTFTTPNITTTTTFYAEAVNNTCPSDPRTPVTVTVAPVPSVTSTTPGSVCGQGTATLEATSSAGTIDWYPNANGGTPLGSGTTFTTPSITLTTVYYAEAVNNGCSSPTRTAVTATVEPLPTVSVTTPAYVCVEGTTTLEATPSAGTVNWYTAATGGTPIGTGTSFTSPYITTATTFYAEAVHGGCSSASRVAVNAVITQLPDITVTTPVTVCDESSVTLEATPSAGTVNWYLVPTGGIAVGTGESFATPAITADTTYYAEAVNNGCASASREPVAITVLAKPDVEDEAVVFCENAQVTLEAGITDVTYDWSTGETTDAIVVAQAGTYTVTVTNTAGCSSVKTFTVSTLQAPDIVDVQVNNDVATIVMGDPVLSNYEYSLNGVTYQASNVFTGVISGYKTAYARSVNDCGTDSFNFIVYIIPKFFTPNSDSVNDRFTISGMVEFPEATITIFDRYGKLITHLTRLNRSWDGTLNGRPLPATDYWYVIKIDDATPEIKGHFSLLR